MTAEEKIVDLFGDEALRVITDTPEQLAKIKGISRERALKINESYMAVHDKEQLIMFLQKFNIHRRGDSRIARFYTR